MSTWSKKSDGLPVKKPTELIHSDDNLVEYFQDLRCGRFPKRCNGNHAHLTGQEAHVARAWPWDFVRRMAWGIVRIRSGSSGATITRVVELITLPFLSMM